MGLAGGWKRIGIGAGSGLKGGGREDGLGSGQPIPGLVNMDNVCRILIPESRRVFITLSSQSWKISVSNREESHAKHR